MSQTASVWIVIVAAFLAANIPFLTERVLGVMPLKVRRKNFAARVGELAVFYFIVGAIGLLLEKRLGEIAPQGWEFYAVTAAVFITLAFPGFVWRYLRKHHE